MSPWTTIETRITNATVSKIRLASLTSELRTSSANRIPATPFGPNQAMNARYGAGSPTRKKEIVIATGRAIASANAMKTTSGGMSSW